MQVSFYQSREVDPYHSGFEPEGRIVVTSNPQIKLQKITYFIKYLQLKKHEVKLTFTSPHCHFFFYIYKIFHLFSSNLKEMLNVNRGVPISLTWKNVKHFWTFKISLIIPTKKKITHNYKEKYVLRCTWFACILKNNLFGMSF